MHMRLPRSVADISCRSADFEGKVHSIFAKACNISCGATLPDRRRGRDCGRTHHDQACARSSPGPSPSLSRGRTTALPEPHCVDRQRRPGARGCRDLAPGPSSTCRIEPAVGSEPAAIGSELNFASTALKHRRVTHSSVLDREAAPVLRALGEATRRLDARKATAVLDRLIGWGEGLTPAGDDFLVGWCASLGALADGSRRSIADSCVASVRRDRAANVTDHSYRRTLPAPRRARPLQRRRRSPAQCAPGVERLRNLRSSA